MHKQNVQVALASLDSTNTCNLDQLGGVEELKCWTSTGLGISPTSVRSVPSRKLYLYDLYEIQVLKPHRCPCIARFCFVMIMMFMLLLEWDVFGNPATTWTTSFPSMSSIGRRPETSLLQTCFLICNFRVLRLTKSALDSKFGSTQVFDRMRRDTFDEHRRAGLSDRLVRMLQLICQKWRANMLASENFVEARMRKRQPCLDAKPVWKLKKKM